MLPQSMDELVYFTQRAIGKGEATTWVYKGKCLKCATIMGKPKDKKGKVLIRAKEYVCPKCGYTAEKAAYEESLTAQCLYICPHCGAKGETTAPYRRKKIEGVDTLRFKCQKCSGNIDVTKKMKAKGGKKADVANADEKAPEI